MQKEIQHWTKPPSRPGLPDNRGWWAQWRTSNGDIVDVQGPFKTRRKAQAAKIDPDYGAGDGIVRAVYDSVGG